MSAEFTAAPIRPLRDLDQTAALALNNANATELSPADPESWARLVASATLAIGVASEDGRILAFLIAFDDGKPPTGPNHRWFQDRLDRFVYIDRVATAPEARGKGLASRLYERAAEVAHAMGRDQLVCEVNIDPPNPASDAFHAARGFEELGRAHLPDRGKTVRYLRRWLVP